MPFSGKTSAPDGMPPRALAALSDRCLAALCESYALWDRTHWPSSEAAQISTILIPKRDGGLRPIALFRTLYRLYSRADTHLAKQWASTTASSTTGNNATGRWVGDSTWRIQARANTTRHLHRAEFLLDLKRHLSMCDIPI
jgi:hypothetical protein